MRILIGAIMLSRSMRRLAPLLCLLVACSSVRPYRIVVEGDPPEGTVPVAVVHLKSINGSIDDREQGLELLEKNFRRGAQLVRIAANRGAKVVVMPEYNMPGVRVHRYERKSVSTTLPKAPTARPLWEYDLPGLAPQVASWARLAKETDTYIVTNFIEADAWIEEPRYYNTLLAIAPDGRLLTAYRKINLYLWEWLIESPGHEEGYFDTPWGRFGLCLCLDAIVPWTLVRLRNTHDCDFFVASTLWEQIPWTGHAILNLVADVNGRPVLWANQSRPIWAGGCGVFRPGIGENVWMGVHSDPGVLVANLPIAKRALEAREKPAVAALPPSK